MFTSWQRHGLRHFLALALEDTHGRFASYWNVANHRSGHLWQSRYYSCVPDEIHVWEALRYRELNPVRALLVTRAEKWSWSGAGVHCGRGTRDPWLLEEFWENRWNRDS